MEAFEEVGAFEVFMMGLREAVEGEGFFDSFLDPGGEFGVFGLPAFEPGGEVLAGFGGVAPDVEPAKLGQALRSAVAHSFCAERTPQVAGATIVAGFAWDVVERITQEVDGAALPAGFGMRKVFTAALAGIANRQDAIRIIQIKSRRVIRTGRTTAGMLGIEVKIREKR